MLLDTQPNSHHVRLVYGSPASYHTRRVDVGVRALAAGKAHEVIASLPVALLILDATRKGEARIPGLKARVSAPDLR